MLPDLLGKLQAATSREEIDATLSSMAEQVQLESVIHAAGDDQVLWQEREPEVTNTKLRMRQEGIRVSARFPIDESDAELGCLKFVWQSEQGDVGPQMDIMLQLIVDQAARLYKVQATKRIQTTE